MPDGSSSHPATGARLALGFARDGATTRLVERSHAGPLRVQKALYPEGGAVCHAIVVHPPGGVVGGDTLDIGVRVADGAHAFIASPGAAKWYKANGKVSRQDVRIVVGAGGALEWMPQEAIVFNHAQLRLTHAVELAADASYIGCEILCFGRRASGERFDDGAVRQLTQIRRGGKLLWWEQGVLDGAGSAMGSPFGLAGMSVCATLIAVGTALNAAQLAQVRAALPELRLTQMKHVCVARHLGHDSETARRLMLTAWQQLRPALLGRAGQVPRIWNT